MNEQQAHKYHKMYEREVTANPFFREYLKNAYQASHDYLSQAGWEMPQSKPNVLLCGVGSAPTAEEFVRFIGKRSNEAVINILDLSEVPLQSAKAKLDITDIPGNPTIGYINANALHIPIADASVDLIETDFFIQFFSPDDRDKLFQEWKRVLKPGGVVTTRDFAQTDRPLSRALYELQLQFTEKVLGAKTQRNTPQDFEGALQKAGFDFKMNAGKIPFTDKELPVIQFITARKPMTPESL